MEKRYYIAYGSNLNVPQMRMRCPSARRIGTSELKGYELLFKGSKTGSYLTVEKKPGRSVPVGVWEVTQADEKALDRYEGFPNFYYKKELTLPIKGIRTGKVRKRRVFVYIMHENRSIGIPSISYMQTCIQGYDDFGFDRLVTLLLGLEDIRDVIAFPKVQNASELMTRCPSEPDPKALEELGLAIVSREEDEASK